MQVFWHFISVSWIKVNIGGLARGAPSFANCEGIFKGSHGEYVSNFFTFLGIPNAH